MSGPMGVALSVLAGLGLLPTCRLFLAAFCKNDRVRDPATCILTLRKTDLTSGISDRQIARASALWEDGYICYPKAPAEILEAARHFKTRENENIVVDDATLPIVTYLVDLVREDVLAYLGAKARVDNLSLTSDRGKRRRFLQICLEARGIPTI